MVDDYNSGQGMTTGVISLDFCKDFDTVLHNVILSKFKRAGFDGQTVR